MSADEIFLEALHNRKKLSVTFNSIEKGIITRECIPFDFGPWRGSKDNQSRYHFYDLDSPEGSHTLSILPSQVIEFKILPEGFDPADYIKWTPNWYIKRDWDSYS